MPTAPLTLALAQIDVTVGDLAGNEQKIREHVARAREAGAHVVLFPELAVTGYPPEDLLIKEHFLADTRAAVERIAGDAHDIVVMVGFPERSLDVFNALAICADGGVQAVYRKVWLPNYGVFDEQRYFQSSTQGAVMHLGDVGIGLTICEDLWEPGPPASDEAQAGATVIVNASASPYHADKGNERERMLIQRARDNLAVVAYCNLVGGQDELVFDGHSVVIDHEGTVLARGRSFEEELIVVNVDPEAASAARLRDTRHRPLVRAARAEVDELLALPAPARREGALEAELRTPPVPPAPERLAEVYAALTTGLRDYVTKNGFQHVVIGLSGGIDSALVAYLAADALGPEAVTSVVMPSPYSSDDTQGDARALAANLGIECRELTIAPAMESYRETLEQSFAGREDDLTEENLQARIRGNLLMALSNKFGWLVLTTGNKSELSVGYSTLYGDMAGGFAVIKDVPKTLVYKLSRHRGVEPRSIIDRAPSAELRPDQRDEDSLPPYSVLDPILEAYVERDLGRDAIARLGHDPDEVSRVIRLVDLAEYKRRQAPPGIKITTKAFGRDRRMPITNRYGG